MSLLRTCLFKSRVSKTLFIHPTLTHQKKMVSVLFIQNLSPHKVSSLVAFPLKFDTLDLQTKKFYALRYWPWHSFASIDLFISVGYLRHCRFSFLMWWVCNSILCRWIVQMDLMNFVFFFLFPNRLFPICIIWKLFLFFFDLSFYLYLVLFFFLGGSLIFFLFFLLLFLDRVFVILSRSFIGWIKTS